MYVENIPIFFVAVDSLPYPEGPLNSKLDDIESRELIPSWDSLTIRGLDEGGILVKTPCVHRNFISTNMVTTILTAKL